MPQTPAPAPHVPRDTCGLTFAIVKTADKCTARRRRVHFRRAHIGSLVDMVASARVESRLVTTTMDFKHVDGNLCFKVGRAREINTWLCCGSDARGRL